jgi:hypothetical protein
MRRISPDTPRTPGWSLSVALGGTPARSCDWLRGTEWVRERLKGRRRSSSSWRSSQTFYSEQSGRSRLFPCRRHGAHGGRHAEEEEAVLPLLAWAPPISDHTETLCSLGSGWAGWWAALVGFGPLEVFSFFYFYSFSFSFSIFSFGLLIDFEFCFADLNLGVFQDFI